MQSSGSSSAKKIKSDTSSIQLTLEEFLNVFSSSEKNVVIWSAESLLEPNIFRIKTFNKHYQDFSSESVTQIFR